MKSLVPIAAIAAIVGLTGCTSFQQASHGSWLDHVGERQAVRYPLTAEEAKDLNDRAAPLRASADAIRVKLAVEKDRVQRIRYMRELESIGDQLRPIEKVLAQGGWTGERSLPPSWGLPIGGQ